MSKQIDALAAALQLNFPSIVSNTIADRISIDGRYLISWDNTNYVIERDYTYVSDDDSKIYPQELKRLLGFVGSFNSNPSVPVDPETPDLNNPSNPG